jgi:hypothetical protein
LNFTAILNFQNKYFFIKDEQFNNFTRLNDKKRFDVHLEFGHHFVFSCLATLISFFFALKSLKKLKKKIRHFEIEKNFFYRHLGFSQYFEILRLATYFFQLKVFKNM